MPKTLRARLVYAFLLPTLLLFALTSLLAYALSRQAVEEELGRSLAAVAAAGASQLSGERLLTIEPGDDTAQSRTWRNVVATLTEVRDAARLRRVFAVDREGRLRADTASAVPVGATLPELARDRLELARVYAGEPVASQVLFTGEDGQSYKTGYAPIRSGDQVVGAVGVEGSAQFYAPLRRLPALFAALGALTLLTLGAAVYLNARSVSEPVRRLVAAAQRIGRGDLETRVPREESEEIGALARELDAMRDALAARDRRLTLMIGGVAHEVRNPLGGMKLFSGLLADELAAIPDRPDAREYLARIRSELEYLERFVEDFLSFAREQKLSPIELDPASLLDAVRSHLQAEADKRGVKLVVSAAQGKLSGDETLLSAALINLTKNALQASSTGAEVELTGVPTGDSYLLEVTDHGGGISAEVREKIFEPFFTTREQGTGLGLPLARKIVQAHHGTLTVASEPGRTVFTITLPARVG